jgi:hypothetical protein
MPAVISITSHSLAAHPGGPAVSTILQADLQGEARQVDLAKTNTAQRRVTRFGSATTGDAGKYYWVSDH